MNNDFKQEETPVTPREKGTAPTPLYLRILALLGALAMIGLSIAYAYAIATGSIFWL